MLKKQPEVTDLKSVTECKYDLFNLCNAICFCYHIVSLFQERTSRFVCFRQQASCLTPSLFWSQTTYLESYLWQFLDTNFTKNIACGMHFQFHNHDLLEKEREKKRRRYYERVYYDCCLGLCLEIHEVLQSKINLWGSALII